MECTRLLIGFCSALFSVQSIASPFYGFGSTIDRYIQDSAQRYQIPEAMLRGLVKMEDGWHGKISPTGATGVGQFTRNTWNWLATTDGGRALGMRPVTSYNVGTASDPRRNKQLNTLATGLLARWHVEQFRLLGIRVTDENLYMAHNIGLEGLRRALSGRATRDDIKNMRRNGMKSWMSVNDFLSYQKSRYNTHKREANFMGQQTAYVARASQPMRRVKPTSAPTTSPSSASVSLEQTARMRRISPSTAYQASNSESQMRQIQPIRTVVAANNGNMQARPVRALPTITIAQNTTTVRVVRPAVY